MDAVERAGVAVSSRLNGPTQALDPELRQAVKQVVRDLRTEEKLAGGAGAFFFLRGLLHLRMLLSLMNMCKVR